MPDSRAHRSAGPRDRELFAAPALPGIAAAVEHLSWLLSRGYPPRSSLALVGDRFLLTARQRDAVGRSACSDESLTRRRLARVPPDQLAGRSLAIDAYNVLTTIESALGGGVVLRGRDGCLRDLATMHGTWRRVVETVPALELARTLLLELGARRATWYLDAPVSNSGRLRGLVAESGSGLPLAWEAELVSDADAAVLASGDVAVSADRRVLDGCDAWFGLANELIPERTPGAWVVDLGAPPA